MRAGLAYEVNISPFDNKVSQRHAATLGFSVSSCRTLGPRTRPHTRDKASTVNDGDQHVTPGSVITAPRGSRLEAPVVPSGSCAHSAHKDAQGPDPYGSKASEASSPLHSSGVASRKESERRASQGLELNSGSVGTVSVSELLLRVVVSLQEFFVCAHCVADEVIPGDLPDLVLLDR